MATGGQHSYINTHQLVIKIELLFTGEDGLRYLFFSYLDATFSLLFVHITHKDHHCAQNKYCETKTSPPCVSDVNSPNN